MKLYLKIVLGEWSNSNRDRRELEAARELGYDIIVIAPGKKGVSPYWDDDKEFDVLRIPTRKYGSGKLRICLGHLAGLVGFVKEARKYNPAVLSGHNYEGVLVGYCSQLFKRKKPIYIYDCHEFELFQIKRGFVKFHLVKFAERFVIHHCDINMMVTDAYADEVQRLYKLDDRPLVVRNIPPKQAVNEDIKRKNRAEFQKHLSISREGTIVIYHGGIASGRGIEELINAVAQMDDVGLVVLGYSLDEGYMHLLKNLTKHHGIEARIYFKDVVPFGELYGYLAAADIVAVLIQNTCKSFYYCLPNKLFEAIQAMTPVIGSDFPEMGRVISEYGVGLTIQPDDIDAIIKAITQLREDKDIYSQIKMNLAKTREILCWQEEKKKLKDAIQSVNVGTGKKQ